MANNWLLTGANGFLGNYIKTYLKSLNITVDTVGINPANTFECDLSSTVPNLKVKYDVVIHSAGKAHAVPKTVSEIEAFYKVNVDGTKNLLKALAANPPKSFIFISTIAVYGVNEANLISENSPLLATEPYGISKILAEEEVIKWCEKHGCISTVLRLPLIVGGNPPGNLGAMIKGIKKGFYFRIGNGIGKKSMVLAEDVAKIIVVAAPIGGIYNLTDGHHPSFSEIENVLGRIFNKKIKVLPSFLAKLIGYGGDMINFALQKRIFPLDSRAYQKIKSTLTIDDSLAREKLGWKPNSVLVYLKNNII